MWIVYAFLSALTAAFVAIFGKLGLQEINATLATTVRTIIMAILLVFISLTTLKLDLLATSSWSAKHWGYIILSAVAGALSLLFYFAALKFGPVSKVAAIDRLSLIFVIVFSAIILGEQLSLKIGAGAALIITGTYLIMFG